ncbi:MAG TPA: hypothetical protein VJH03_24230 [Blastocatellia bacterium]|nr:hypothetical protein [Blastocatellia bacterium]
MPFSILSTDQDSTPSKVSVVARLIPAASYAIPAVGSAASALLVFGVMRAMRLAASTGVAAVAAGLAEANIPVLIALYLAILCGVAGIVVAVIRSIAPTTTVSPSPWFFAVGGGLALIPVVLLWEAESELIQVFSPSSTGLASTASTIQLLLTLTMILAPVSLLLLLAGSVWPLTSFSKPKWRPVVALIAVELAMIVAVIAFQTRIAWLNQIAVEGRFLG